MVGEYNTGQVLRTQDTQMGLAGADGQMSHESIGVRIKHRIAFHEEQLMQLRSLNDRLSGNRLVDLSIRDFRRLLEL
jgi:hypothetical protein